MPIEIKDLDDGMGVSIIGRGVVTEEEYVDTLKKHLTQDKNKFKKYRYSISDYTAATKEKVPTKAINLIAQLCKEAALVNPDAVVAVVADKDITYGLSRMWEFFLGEIIWEVMVFRSRHDAETWVKKRVNEKFGINDLTMA